MAAKTPRRTPRRIRAREIRIIFRTLGEESVSFSGFRDKLGMTEVGASDSRISPTGLVAMEGLSVPQF